MSVLIVVPTYNERENIRSLISAIFKALPVARILIVDDNSPDGTGLIADDLSSEFVGRVFVLHRTTKEGLGRAYIAAYAYALETFEDTEFFVQMDADLSHDPSYLPNLISCASQCDVVIASRYMNGISIVNWPLHRLIISKFGTWFAQVITGLPITDCTGGFKCFRRAVLEEIDLASIRANGYVFQVETSFRAWRLGFRLRDIPIIFYERRFGSSKLHLNVAIEAFFIVLRLGLVRLSRAGTRSRTSGSSRRVDEA